MVAHRKEKISNAICFFANEHKKLANKLLTQTYLYKYLAFLDFFSVRKTGIPAFDLRYKAMVRGPVPDGLYNNRRNLKTDLFEFEEAEEAVFKIRPKGKPNLDYFTEYEIDLMKKLVAHYAKEYGNTDEICDDSHKKIKAWERAYRAKKNSSIDFRLMFGGDITKKKAGDLSPTEERYLVYAALKEKTG